MIARFYSSKVGKIVLSSAVGAGLLFSGAGIASASTLTTAQIQAVVSLLTAFGADPTTIATVQTALSGQTATTSASSTTTVSGTPSAVTIFMIGKLKAGDQGDAVKYLQTLLAADTSVYPQGIVSGYFGPLTTTAVKNFQKAHGLAMVGFIGPATLAALEAELAANPLGIDTSGTSTSTVSTSQGHSLCAIVPPGHLIAPGWLKHHGNEKPTIPACQTLPPGIEHHGDEGNEHGTTTPPAVTLSVSNVATSGITSSAATITWLTTLAATSQVEYGTTTSYGSASALDSNLVTSHSVMLGSLQPSTTYHFRVDATVGSSTASSGDMTFTTLAVPDTTAPVISAVVVSGVGSTTANVSWTTNELATSKVYFATTTPINLSTAMTQSSSTLVTAHSLTLNSLMASTTYQYVVESADASSNTATTSAATFTTSN